MERDPGSSHKKRRRDEKEHRAHNVKQQRKAVGQSDMMGQEQPGAHMEHGGQGRGAEHEGSKQGARNVVPAASSGEGGGSGRQEGSQQPQKKKTKKHHVKDRDDDGVQASKRAAVQGAAADGAAAAMHVANQHASEVEASKVRYKTAQSAARLASEMAAHLTAQAQEAAAHAAAQQAAYQAALAAMHAAAEAAEHAKPDSDARRRKPEATARAAELKAAYQAACRAAHTAEVAAAQAAGKQAAAEAKATKLKAAYRAARTATCTGARAASQQQEVSGLALEQKGACKPSQEALRHACAGQQASQNADTSPGRAAEWQQAKAASCNQLKPIQPAGAKSDGMVKAAGAPPHRGVPAGEPGILRETQRASKPTTEECNVKGRTQRTPAVHAGSRAGGGDKQEGSQPLLKKHEPRAHIRPDHGAKETAADAPHDACPEEEVQAARGASHATVPQAVPHQLAAAAQTEQEAACEARRTSRGALAAQTAADQAARRKQGAGEEEAVVAEACTAAPAAPDVPAAIVRIMPMLACTGGAGKCICHPPAHGDRPIGTCETQGIGQAAATTAQPAQRKALSEPNKCRLGPAVPGGQVGSEAAAAGHEPGPSHQIYEPHNCNARPATGDTSSFRLGPGCPNGKWPEDLLLQIKSRVKNFVETGKKPHHRAAVIELGACVL